MAHTVDNYSYWGFNSELYKKALNEEYYKQLYTKKDPNQSNTSKIYELGLEYYMGNPNGTSRKRGNEIMVRNDMDFKLRDGQIVRLKSGGFGLVVKTFNGNTWYAMFSNGQFNGYNPFTTLGRDSCFIEAVYETKNISPLLFFTDKYRSSHYFNEDELTLLWELPKKRVELTIEEIAEKFGVDVDQVFIKD